MWYLKKKKKHRLKDTETNWWLPAGSGIGKQNDIGEWGLRDKNFHSYNK